MDAYSFSSYSLWSVYVESGVLKRQVQGHVLASNKQFENRSLEQ